MAAQRKTKAYHRFKQRCDYYETDLELCDLLVRDFIKMADSDGPVAAALGSSKSKHPKLGQKNTKRTREVRGGHLRATLQASFVKDLYEDFIEFLAETMARAAQKGIDPNRFAGNMKLEIKATDLLAAGSWDGVVTIISQKVFRALEGERKTTELIKKAATRLGLKIDQAIIDAAMPYLDARHMLVHQDGRADELYSRKHKSVVVKNGKIVLDSTFTAKARDTIDALARAIDQEIIGARLVKPEHMHP